MLTWHPTQHCWFAWRLLWCWIFFLFLFLFSVFCWKSSNQNLLHKTTKKSVWAAPLSSRRLRLSSLWAPAHLFFFLSFISWTLRRRVASTAPTRGSPHHPQLDKILWHFFFILRARWDLLLHAVHKLIANPSIASFLHPVKKKKRKEKKGKKERNERKKKCATANQSWPTREIKLSLWFLKTLFISPPADPRASRDPQIGELVYMFDCDNFPWIRLQYFLSRRGRRFAPSSSSSSSTLTPAGPGTRSGTPLLH